MAASPNDSPLATFSPSTTLTSLSRDDSTDVSFTSPESTRHQPQRRRSSHKIITTAYATANEEDSQESPLDGYVSDHIPQTARAPRYPNPRKATPLSPHRLARIANSLGVRTPVPHSAPGQSSSSSRNSRRPVGSGAGEGTGSFPRHRTTTATRLLLNVVPPADLVAATSSSSTRRGVLLPLHSTLQGQLAAIARYHNLPSTGGMVVYLLDAKDEDLEEYVGPRITDEAWKLLWRRVFKMEREEVQRGYRLPSSPSPSSLPTPTDDGASDVESNSHETENSDHLRLRPLRTLASISSSPSTSSFASITSHDSSPFNRQPSLSPQHPRTASLASNTSSQASSSSRILPATPVVGKIEFEIDRSKGIWYETWLRRVGRGEPIAPNSSSILHQPSASADSTTNSLPSNLKQFLASPTTSRSNTPNFLLPSVTPTSEFHFRASSFSSSHSDTSSSHHGISNAGAQSFVQTPITPDYGPEMELSSGYAPLEDDHEDENHEDEENQIPDDNLAEDEEETIDEVEGEHEHKDTAMQGDLGVDEDDWRELQHASVAPSSTSEQTPMPADSDVLRRRELIADLEADVEELDPIGMVSSTEDVNEVVAMLDAKRASASISPPPLSSPIALRSEQEAFSPIPRPQPTSRKSAPPPLHIADSALAEPSVKVSQPSPTTPSAIPIASEDENENEDEESNYSDQSEDQVALRKNLDTLEKTIAHLSPRALPEEQPFTASPSHSSPPPRLSPQQLLERMQNSPRSPLAPSTPRFMTEFARPTPGQPLIDKVLPLNGRISPHPSQWPSTSVEHGSQELRVEGQTPLALRSPGPLITTFSESSSDPASRSSHTPPEFSETRGRRPTLDESDSTHRPSSESIRPSESALARRPATPAVLDPPPRTFSLPQPPPPRPPSSRFSADSSIADGAEDSPSPNASRVSVRNFTKLFRSRSKSREPPSRLSRESDHPPVPSSSRVPPIPSPIPSPMPSRPPSQNTTRVRDSEDSGTDPFHFDQPPSRKSDSPQPMANSRMDEVDPKRSSGFKKRGILKGWGTSSKPKTQSGKLSRENSDEMASRQSTSSSRTSSVKGPKGGAQISRSDSWTSMSREDGGFAVSPPSEEHLGSTTPTIASPTSYTGTDTSSLHSRARSDASSLRPPISPTETESSGGPRPSVDEVMTPRTSQFDIITPSAHGLGFEGDESFASAVAGQRL